MNQIADIKFVGPSIKEGKLAAIYYFALSAEDSLHLDPYNQPVTLLSRYQTRIFSKTLPYHGPGFDKKEAMHHWKEALLQNHLFLGEIIEEVQNEIEALIQKQIIDPEKIAVMGLSRGGLIATHLAARSPRIQTILSFSPLVTFDALDNFKPYKDQPQIHSLALENLSESLIQKKIRFYIGNRDERVSTESCFSFIHHLADTAWRRGIRSPSAELIINPSIGHKGHGTSYETFKDGVTWLAKTLNLTLRRNGENEEARDFEK